ncbi:uncharacterized protein LOC143447439 [Clavelina lepadiformis]|uniref:uncharacterized protein LOC143447439 n=1 Tax=Clavelina lepadiformis TaxID=159417 RepID=UPI0040421C65
MSFMYKSMISRGPGKRKIKLQEENILRLMQDDEDDEEEDQDFKLDEAQQRRASDDSVESGTDDSDSQTSADENGNTSSEDEKNTQNVTESLLKSESVKHNTQRRHRRDKPFILPTVQSARAQIQSKYPSLPTILSETLTKSQKQLEISKAMVQKCVSAASLKSCVICLSRKNAENITGCGRCGVTVHKSCYGDHFEYKHPGRSKWFCDCCLSDAGENCEFCPNTSGCMKETSSGQWCHVVCARYILGGEMFESNHRYINMSALNYKLYGSKECSLCEDRLVARTGICVKCDAGLCKTFFHVTCAQRNGLLSENESESETDPYFVYCALHLGKEKMIESQRFYFAAFAAVDALKRKHGSGRQRIHDMEILQKQRKQFNESEKDCFPRVPTSACPPSRQLTSNAAAVRLLNRKAEIMFGINVRSPASYFPQPSHVRKRHRVAPALTPEFASHYADRELRINEVTENLKRVADDNRKLLEDESGLRNKYNDVREELASMENQENEIIKSSRDLFSMFSQLKRWSKDNQHDLSQNHEFRPLKRDVNIGNESGRMRGRKRPMNDQPSLPSTVKAQEVASSNLLKICDICKSDKEQHLLVQCDVCKRSLHLGCCEPPLTQMPKKTKFSLWQCSECVSSSEEESAESEDTNHGSYITPEGRRQTQRSHRPPEKLATMLFNDQQLLEQRKMINNITRSFRKNRNERRKKNPPWLHGKGEEGKLGISMKSKQIKKIAKNSALKPADRILEQMKDKNLDKAHVVVHRSSQIELTDKLENSNQNQPNFSFPVCSIVPPLGGITLVDRSSISGTDVGGSPPGKLIPAQLVKPVILPKSDIFKMQGTSVAIRPMISSENAVCSVADQLRKLVKSIKIAPVSPTVAAGKSEPALTEKTSPKMLPTTTPKALTSLTPMTSEKLRKIVKVDPPPTPQSEDTSERESVPTSSITIQDCTRPAQESDSPRETPPACDVCGKDDSLKEMVRCGACFDHYHIWCCDPPLTSVPKTSKFAYWECAKCSSKLLQKEEEDEASGGIETTPDGRRKITRMRKPPEKFATLFYSAAQQKMLKSFLSRRARVVKSAKVKKEPYRLEITYSAAQAEERRKDDVTSPQMDPVRPPSTKDTNDVNVNPEFENPTLDGGSLT